MLTFFTIPKAFTGHTGLIQRNALRSWRELDPKIQILLLGDDGGVKEAAQEFGCEHLPSVTRSSWGTPMVDAAFRMADEAARFPLLCYANADIIFLPSMAKWLRNLQLKRGLVSGHKWMSAITEEINFQQLDEKNFRQKYCHGGQKAGPCGMDFFIYPRGQYRQMPPLIVGRPGWDNWMVYDTLRRSLPFILLDQAQGIIHQDHDTSHVPQKKAESRWEGPEAEFNRRSIQKSRRLLFTLKDATHELFIDGSCQKIIPEWQYHPKKLQALYPYSHWWRRQFKPQPLRRLELPSVTLVCIADDAPEDGATVLRYSQKEILFGDVQLIGSKKVEEKGFRFVRVDPIDSGEKYNFFVLRELWRHVHTKHVLIVQPDGYVLNAKLWTNQFLQYDYIGAPWFQQKGVPAGMVGNGGFSLRSRNLLEAVSRLAPSSPEDACICLTHGQTLEEQGFRFAPTSLAARFSHEDGKRRPTFGFHTPWHPQKHPGPAYGEPLP